MLAELQRAIIEGKYNITNHADEELVKDALMFADVREALMRGEVTEDYPNDFPYPSCLVFGMNAKNEPIHAVWVYATQKEIAVLVTAYRPDPRKWIDSKIRRKYEPD